LSTKGEGIHERSLVEEDRIAEYERLVLEGVDISGRWSTLIEPRVLNDFDRTLFNEVKAHPKGNHINRCWQCGNCTAVCPVPHEYPDFNPRFFIYLLQLGHVRELRRRAHAVWHCRSCGQCSQRCPVEADPSGIMEALATVVKRHFPGKLPPR